MGQTVAAAAVWMVGYRFFDRAVGLVSTMVLARLLVPDDFGLVMMAMSFIALIELAGAFSFELPLIQRQNPTKAHFDTAWTLNLLFACLCAAITAGMAPIAASFYDEPRLVAVMLALAGGWAVQGLENIGTVNFRRKMNFKLEFKFLATKRVVGFAVTMVLALTYGGYWSLVVGAIAGRVAGALLSYLMSDFRPRLSLQARRDLFDVSGWLFLSNVLSFALSRGTHFVVGRTHGAAALGTYALAGEFARLPSTELSAPINRALFPGLSRVGDDPSAWAKLYLQAFGATMTIALPASVGLALLSDLFVAAILGPKWTAAGQIMTVLALAGTIETISANAGIAYLSLGRPRIIAALGGLKLILLVAAAIALVPAFGILGMALAELTAAGFAVVAAVVVFVQISRIAPAQLLLSFWRAGVATSLMTCVIWPAKSLIREVGFKDGSALIELIALTTLGAVVYLISMIILWAAARYPDGIERRVTEYLAVNLAKFRARH